MGHREIWGLHERSAVSMEVWGWIEMLGWLEALVCLEDCWVDGGFVVDEV